MYGITASAFKVTGKPGVAAHTVSTSTQETEVGGSHSLKPARSTKSFRIASAIT